MKSKFTKFTHKTSHLKGKQHQVGCKFRFEAISNITQQFSYVDRDADGDVDVYDNPKRGITDEKPYLQILQQRRKN
jgi:hypothetical protein